MKCTREHFEAIKNAVCSIDTPERRKAYSDNGLSNVRYAWDCFWSAQRTNLLSREFVNSLYAYMNDSNIQTALFSALNIK